MEEFATSIRTTNGTAIPAQAHGFPGGWDSQIFRHTNGTTLANDQLDAQIFNTFITNTQFNTLNAQLNPICHLLALLGAHHILHISRIRVNHTRRILSEFYYYLFTLISNAANYITVIQGNSFSEWRYQMLW